MNNGDAADQIVSMSLKGLELMAKITGAGAKNLATYLYAVLKSQKKTKGKTRLEGLLRSGKELKVFAVKSEDLRKFTEEAKRYGVLYCALRDKKNLDGMCDIMVRAEDAPKINRIVERFKLATVDTASIKNEITESKAANIEKTTDEKGAGGFSEEPMLKRDSPETNRSNPLTAKTETSRPSEPIYERKGASAGDTIKPERKSVRRELNEIRAARAAQAGEKNNHSKEQVKSTKQTSKAIKHMTGAKFKKPIER